MPETKTPAPAEKTPTPLDLIEELDPNLLRIGPELAPHQVILRPLITEKGTHQASRYNTYAFQVNPLADKQMIREAVEELFNVRVVHVHTITKPGKRKRFKGRWGKLPDRKKALVKLAENDKLDFV